MTKILIVEDGIDLAQLITRELKACGYEVIAVDNGLSALDIHAKQAIDLIILDWVLPELDGLEVLRRLRQRSATPVLMLTGRVDEIDRVLGLEVGADDYLVKPFSMRELVARTRAMLRRAELIQHTLATARQAGAIQASYGPLSIDSETHTARLNGKLLDLSRTEFDLLHLILQSPGRVFERAYLLETIWGELHVKHDRSVDNVIHRLRRKLGDFGDCIETVHGVGYRLRVNE
ncbi:MAG: response regulator transcription factor [Aggregatilineales bacterium]